MSSRSSTSSRSTSPTLTVSSSEGLYIPVHKRSSASSTSGSSRTSSSASESSDSDSVISSPATPTFIYSRDTLLNLANSPLSRMAQPERDNLRSEVPEVMSNRKQRKAIDYFNHMSTVQANAALRVSPPTHSSRSSHSNHPRKPRLDKQRTPKPAAV